MFERVINILTDEYGLVDGRLEPSTGDYRVLVWEDEWGIGRYRVHCYANHKWRSPNNGKIYDVFNFHYWVNQEKFDRDVFSKDPMREPLQRIVSLSENRYETNNMINEASVDELERYVLMPKNNFA